MTEAAGAAGAGSALLELKGVSAGPPGAARPVLTGVHLRLERGQVGVLLGGNGAGKSTLLRTAAGLWPPLEGEVRSAAGSGFDPRVVTLVLEEPAAQFTARTVAGELEFALENAAVPTEEIPGRRDAVLERLGLAVFAGRDPLTLSGGEQELCLLAAALVLRPAVLLLDDPFLYVGSAAGRPAWLRLREEIAAGRVGAALLASHDAELAAEANRVGVVADGALARWGHPGEVLREPLPEGVMPPLGVLLEEVLVGAGWERGNGGLHADAVAAWVAGGLGR